MNGISKAFHFYRLFRGDTSQSVSVSRHEHYLFSYLDLRPGMRVLDVGCGVGSVALELADFIQVFVVGIDPNVQKIERAKQSASERSLSSQVTFIHGDYSDISTLLKEKSFDAIYSIESLKYSRSFETIYQDLFRLLRPGCKLAVYEWCWTQEMNPHDTDHRRLAVLLESLTGIGNRPISERSIEAALRALQSCQLQIIHQVDLSTCSNRAMIPWYTPLDEAITNSRTCWSSHTDEEGDFGELTKDAALVLSQAGHLQLFTPMALFVATRAVSDNA